MRHRAEARTSFASEYATAGRMEARVGIQSTY